MRARSSWCAAWAWKSSPRPTSCRWPRPSGRLRSWPAIGGPCDQLLADQGGHVRHVRRAPGRRRDGDRVRRPGLHDGPVCRASASRPTIPPIVGVNAHGADPHFAPDRDADTELHPGDFLLIDLWGKERGPEDIVGDITWVAYAGPAVPPLARQVFDVVKAARDRAVAYAGERPGDWRPGLRLRGRRRLPPGHRRCGLRPVLHPPHGAQHRNRGPRQRRQY